MTFLLRDQDRDRLLGLLDYLAERTLELEDDGAAGRLTAGDAVATARGILERVTPTGGLAPAGVWTVEAAGAIDVVIEPCLEPDSLEGAVERAVARAGHHGGVLLRIVDESTAVPDEGPWRVQVVPSAESSLPRPMELVVRRFAREKLRRWALRRSGDEGILATIAAPPHMAAGVVVGLALRYERVQGDAVEHATATDGRAFAIVRPPGRGMGVVAYDLRDEGPA